MGVWIHPYAEVDGRPYEAIDRKFTFNDRGK
jgi:hypothetical protein